MSKAIIILVLSGILSIKNVVSSYPSYPQKEILSRDVWNYNDVVIWHYNATLKLISAFFLIREMQIFKKEKQRYLCLYV